MISLWPYGSVSSVFCNFTRMHLVLDFFLFILLRIVWVSRNCELMSFINFGNSYPFISSNTASTSFSLPSHSKTLIKLF